MNTKLEKKPPQKTISVALPAQPAKKAPSKPVVKKAAAKKTQAAAAKNLADADAAKKQLQKLQPSAGRVSDRRR